MVITPLIFLNQFRFIILRKSQLLQTAAVNIAFVQPVANIIRALPAEHDFLRVKRKIEPSKNSALKSLDNIFNFAGLKIKRADIAKRVETAVDIIRIIVIRRILHALDKDKFVDTLIDKLLRLLFRKLSLTLDRPKALHLDVIKPRLTSGISPAAK